MRAFTLSIAEGVRGKKTQIIYSTHAEITSIDDLKNATRFDHTAGLFKNNHRKNENLIFADCLIMDCDNDHTEDPSLWLTPKKLSERLNDTEFAIVYSKSHMRVKASNEAPDGKGYSPRERFHVYFALSETIKEADAIRAMKQRLIALIPEFDDGAKDAARFIFGVENPQGFFFEGSLCVDQFLTANADPSFEYDKCEEEDSKAEFDEETNESPAEEETNEEESDIIPDGKRNTTLYQTACRLIRKHGEINAISPFNVACSKCQPPLPPKEIAKIWDNALKFVKSELKKEQKKKKSQSDEERLCAIRDAFLKGKHIFFHGSCLHGEYFQYSKAGYWCSMTDAELRADLSAFLNHKNHKDIGQLASMIRDMVYRKDLPEWNKGRLDNFPNGTLELDSGVFREHRPEDYLTFSHSYSYNPAANDCSTYDSFMPAITKGNQSRIDHLTDIMAYTLYGDNSLEKIFFLIGEGANGKGTFLHLIEDLFSNANPCEDFRSVTHVQPCQFDTPTERIKLEGALINLAYDIEKNLRGCSSYLKSLAGNDVITGNRKFCDSHSFTSRAKVISSCNHIPIIDDDSYGMRRKLCFIRFEAKFDEGKADTHMREKLQAELPAIYNRIYRAYQELRKREERLGQDAIRLSCDQPDFISAFTVFADPVKDFWRTVKQEYLSRGEIRKPEVYEDFRHFAERNNIDLIREGIREKTFHAKFFAVLNEDSGISANNTLRRRDSEDSKFQVYYYTIKQKPEEESTTPEAEQVTPPEHSPSETPPEEDTTAGNEAMTQTEGNPEPPAPQELLPMSEEDAQKWEQLLSGEKIEYEAEPPIL